MTDAHARARRQQRIEEWCAASIRAIAGMPDLHYRSGRLHRGARALPRFAAHLHPSIDTDDTRSFRGAADGLALRVARSDAALHATLAPTEPLERAIFDLLEQFRVESLVPDAMPGMRHNLRHRFEQWSLGFHHSGLNESARGILLYTTAQICRSRVCAEPVLELTEDLIETTRGKLGPRISHALGRLRRHREDQAAYAAHAAAIARIVGELMRARDDERGEGDDEKSRQDNRRGVYDAMLGPEEDEHEGFAVAETGHSRVLAEAPDGYRVFTRAYDREVDAATLARAAVLAEQRTRLDRRIAEQGVNVSRLARALKTLLAVPVADGWDGAQEEGLIDGRRLAQLVSTPAERRLFRIDRLQPTSSTHVSFLVDCSGSMKQHAEPVAMLVDVFARALELADVSVEVLGFTTGAWNGGRAERDWQRAGRPPHPGRLNECCHMVFKAADTPWRRARPAIAALLKPDLFREGVDGEAVQWACRRMEGRGDARRLLFVLSDGSPMDSATHRANDQHYLDHHLREVVMREEIASGVEIVGLGLGLDLSPYYRHSLPLDLAAPAGNRSFHEIVGMVAALGRHRQGVVR
jgi:cobaltochelatase CobT